MFETRLREEEEMTVITVRPGIIMSDFNRKFHQNWELWETNLPHPLQQPGSGLLVRSNSHYYWFNTTENTRREKPIQPRVQSILSLFISFSAPSKSVAIRRFSRSNPLAVLPLPPLVILWIDYNDWLWLPLFSMFYLPTTPRPSCHNGCIVFNNNHCALLT